MNNAKQAHGMIQRKYEEKGLKSRTVFAWHQLPFSWAKRDASRKVTSLSASRSFLLPQRIMMMLGLAKVRASVSQLVRALYVSRLQDSTDRGTLSGVQNTITYADMQCNNNSVDMDSAVFCTPYATMMHSCSNVPMYIVLNKLLIIIIKFTFYMSLSNSDLLDTWRSKTLSST